MTQLSARSDKKSLELFHTCFVSDPMSARSSRSYFVFLWRDDDDIVFFFFFQAEDGIRDKLVTGVQTCALPILTMIGPNCPGVLSPGRANVGIIPAEIFSEGSIGLVSRSGTLTYQIGHELTQLGLGNSTIVGIGGDPVVGSSFIDVLRRVAFGTGAELIVPVGRVGGGGGGEAGPVRRGPGTR